MKEPINNLKDAYALAKKYNVFERLFKGKVQIIKEGQIIKERQITPSICHLKVTLPETNKE